jgi:lipoprotein-releasing system ATP-binding protein
MSKPALALVHIQKTYKQGKEQLNVLKDVSLEVRKGEIVALVGPSGCGKSTLLQIAGLLDKPDDGGIMINGKQCHKLSDKKRTLIRRDELGFVYQYHHLMQEFSAIENVMMPQLIAGVKKKVARQKSEDLLERFGLKERIKHRPAELSGGEQQRVAIARALSNSPSLILADEPTGNLDPNTAAKVYETLLSQMSDLGVSMMMVTHNLELAAQTKNAYVLKEGSLVKA